MMKKRGRRRGSHTQTERVLDLLASLQARRAPALLPELAEAHGVSVRQLRRDLAALGAVGHAVEIVRVEGRSAVRLVRGRSATLALSLRERFALLAMRDVFSALEGTPLAEDARSIFEKVAATMPDDAATELRRLGPRFRYIPDGGIKSYGEHADVVDELLSGALQRWTVDAKYRPAHGRVLHGGFEPWGLALYRNGLYAVGRWEAELGPRVFAVERFTSATRRRGARFEIPDGFSLDAFFGGALGVFPGGEPEKIVLVFARCVATVVTSRRWHATQKTKALSDGRVRLEFEAPISPEVVSWLVGWGSTVRVVAPTTLRDSVAKEHLAALPVDARRRVAKRRDAAAPRRT